MKRNILTFFLLLSTCCAVNAQTPGWQWGKRGGSADLGSGGPDESVVDMATDPHGNVYLLSYVLQTALNVDGHTVTGRGAQDILISSFACDGAYRWSKDIGGNNTDIPTAIKTDTLGGVYITGYIFLNSSIGYFSTDTSVPVTNKTLMLVKYDTSGNYKWLRFPQSDTVGVHSLGNVAAYDMDVDGGGNSYTLAELSPGAYAGGAFVAATQGEYILRYDKDGNFISGDSIQISNPGHLNSLLMKKDFQNGRYYITGTLTVNTLSFGGIPVSHPMFVGCFNSAGSLLWLRRDTDPIAEGSAFGRAAIDGQGYAYLGGRASPSDTFDDYALVDAGSTTPVAFKLDTNGNELWAHNATTNGATFCSNVILNGNEAVIAGRYPGLLKWAGYTDSLNLPSGANYHIFITRFSTATGAVLGIDSLASTTDLYTEPGAMSADRFGNVYIGGDFAYQITVGGDTLTSIGGGSDFFAAKYGTANCDCISPVASFTSSGARTVAFTYTGSAYDSVRWNFGDGSSSAIADPTHTYTLAGTYMACVTAYSACGNDTACQTVTVSPTGVASVAVPSDNISICPNPATEELNVTGITQNTVYRLLSLTGVAVQQGALRAGANAIPVGDCAPGVYILDMTGSDGERTVKKVIKQ